MKGLISSLIFLTLCYTAGAQQVEEFSLLRENAFTLDPA